MSVLKQLVCQALTPACQQALAEPIEHNLLWSSITPSTQTQFGHFQCNLAMRLSKALKRSPKDIAQDICSQLNNSIFSKTEVAGPGFINLWLTTDTINQTTQALLNNPLLGLERIQAERIVIDFSSPNIAKEMHVGHLRSTIIGDSIARILEYLGHDVLRLNHIGDWGTAFGMLIAYLQTDHPKVLTGEQDTNLSELVIWYKAAKKRFDEDPIFKKTAQLKVVALQSGGKEEKQAWQVICDISRQGFQTIYTLLNICLIERGESYYNDRLENIISQLETKKLVTESDGAKVVFLDGFSNRDGDPLPLMVQKSDGGFNYATTDLAALQHRVNDEAANRIIYITDSGQSLHFKMVFSAAEKASFYHPNTVTIEHAGFGLVLGEDGKKLKTRSGETVKLQALLDEAINRAKDILITRNEGWSTDEIKQAAHALGMAAIKYADLSCNRINDYKFSFDRMLQFEGNTAAFILYAYVRSQSIQRKVSTEKIIIANDKLVLAHSSEIELAIHLLDFNTTIEKVAKELLPNILTDYLYQTAHKFNAFFRDCRVEGSDEQDSRILLCQLTGKIIKIGLQLLGIQTLERM
jgi:arginyl-tRNA synthetase